jgi:hypothetical protein
VTLEEATTSNGQTRSLYLVGGFGPDPNPTPLTPASNLTTGNNVFFSDVWKWQLDDEVCIIYIYMYYICMCYIHALYICIIYICIIYMYYIYVSYICIIQGSQWVEDFTIQETYGRGRGLRLRFNASSPANDYISPDSPLSYMQRYC